MIRSVGTGRKVSSVGDGFFDDDGTPLNPDLAPVPSLCVACRYCNSPEQEKLCDLNRLDQAGEDESDLTAEEW